MYIYYILRGTRGDQIVEMEGDVNEESFPGIKLNDGPEIVTSIVQQVRESDQQTEWTECDLTDDFFDREDTYILYGDRWMRRADAPWRKDKSN
ncbi:MAG TPA: hypothetical protein VH593_15375 [Ktedonobacteraceae bacterium]